jgi:uncharacterized protein
LVFSGSSIIELTRQDADLSRRALIYEMTGLSFREYLLLSDIISLPSYPLSEILTYHTDISSNIVNRVPILKYFSSYLDSGFYPIFLEPERDYLMTKWMLKCHKIRQDNPTDLLQHSSNPSATASGA